MLTRVRATPAVLFYLCDSIIIGGICCLLLFTPLAFGAVHHQAYTLMEGLVFFLVALWMGKLVAMQRLWIFSAVRLPKHLSSIRRFFLPLLLFVGLAGLQLIPLPPELLARLSPATSTLYRQSLPGWPEKTPYWEWLQQEKNEETETEILTSTKFSQASAYPVGQEVQGAPVGEWLPLSIAPEHSRTALLKILAYVGFFSLLVLYPIDTQRVQEAERRFVRTIFVTILISGILIATIGIVQRFFWNGKILWFFVPEQWEGALSDITPRASGPFVNGDHFANYLVLILPLLLSGILVQRLFASRKKEITFKIFCVLALCTSFIGILLSLSRGGWIGTGLAACIFLWLLRWIPLTQQSQWFRQSGLLLSRKVALGCSIFVFLTLLFIGPAGRTQLDERLEETLAVHSELIDRLLVWRDSLGMIRDFPLLGVGLGAWPELFPHYQHPPWDPLPWREAHNDYLQCLAETGIIGFCLLVWFFTSVVMRMWRELQTRTSPDMPIVAGIIAALAAMAFHEGFDFNLQIPANALLFTALVAIGLRLTGNQGFDREEQGSNRWRIPLALSVGILACVLGIVAMTQEQVVYQNDPDDFTSLAEVREHILAFPARADGHVALFDLQEENVPLAERVKELEIALWLAPLNPVIRDQYIVALLEQEQQAAALKEVQQSVFNAPTLSSHFYLTPETIPQLDPQELQAIEVGMGQAVTARFANAGMGLGGFYTLLNRFSEAGEAYAKAAENEKRERLRVRLLFKAARAYARSGERGKAESSFRQVCQLTPTDPVPYQLLVNEVLVPRGAITEAKAIVNMGIKQGAPPMVLLMSLAEAVRRAGRMDDAKSILQEVLRRYPRTLDAHVRLGRLFLQEQNFDRAVLTLQKAIELQGNSVSALDLLGQAEEGRKQFGAAEKAYATVLRLDPNNTSVRQRYIALQQRLNENDLPLKGKR